MLRLAGFTLVEILIVVVIMAIIAMLALPRIASSSDEARESALCSDIRTVRQQIEVYKAQHGGHGPHLNENGVTDTANFVARLTGKTDATGKVGEGSMGPYLTEFPDNPYLSGPAASEIEFGTATSSPRNGSVGWYYCIDTCLLSANSQTGGESLDLLDGGSSSSGSDTSDSSSGSSDSSSGSTGSSSGNSGNPWNPWNNRSNGNNRNPRR